MNRLQSLFLRRPRQLLSIYLTVGYPDPGHTVDLICDLEKAGVDFLEVGMPFSDPMADGPTIQHTSEVALAKGMTIPDYFKLVKAARQRTEIPMIFMGYLNQVYRMGVEAFAQACAESGIDGAIIPDLPMDIYQHEIAEVFDRYNLPMSFLISPQTSKERIQQAAALSKAFVYVVADNSITGSNQKISDGQRSYFSRIQSMNLKTPTIIGFGISDAESYSTACEYASGAIVGSAFLRSLPADGSPADIHSFVQGIRPIQSAQS